MIIRISFIMSVFCHFNRQSGQKFSVDRLPIYRELQYFHVWRISPRLSYKVTMWASVKDYQFVMPQRWKSDDLVIHFSSFSALFCTVLYNCQVLQANTLYFLSSPLGQIGTTIIIESSAVNSKGTCCIFSLFAIVLNLKQDIQNYIPN